MFSWSFPGIAPLLRIGELRRRLVVSAHGLRAWESRYGLLQPACSPGVLGQQSWAGRGHSMASFTGGGVVIGDGTGLTHRIRLAFAGGDRGRGHYGIGRRAVLRLRPGRLVIVGEMG